MHSFSIWFWFWETSISKFYTRKMLKLLLFFFFFQLLDIWFHIHLIFLCVVLMFTKQCEGISVWFADLKVLSSPRTTSSICNNPIHTHCKYIHISQVRGKLQQLILQLTAFSVLQALVSWSWDGPHEVIVLFWQMHYIHPHLLVLLSLKLLTNIHPLKWTLDRNKFWYNGKRKT